MFPAQPAQGSIPTAASWMQDLMTGKVATAIAIIAVALLGYEMLAGRLSPRRAMRVLLGCFILFGSPVIVQGLIGAGRDRQDQAPLPLILEPAPPPPLPDARPGPNSNPFDPAARRRPRN